MGADGGIYYLPFTQETLITKLLEMLIEWICSKDCSYSFDGLIFVKNDKIMIAPDNDSLDDEVSPDEAIPFFTDEQLDFITKLRDVIVDHFTSNTSITCEDSNIMTWEQFDDKMEYDSDFGFRDDWCQLVDLTKEINDVWEAEWLWLYWDTESFHYPDPFSGHDGNDELKKLYDSFLANETFKQIFTNFEQFSSFVYDLPETDNITTWT
jgi:hypothetical protein